LGDLYDLLIEDMSDEGQDEIGEHEKDARDECIVLMQEMLERVEKGPRYPKTGPPEHDWAGDDGELTRNGANWARSHGFKPR